MNKKILILKRKIKYARLEVDLESLKIITPENFQFNVNEIFQKHQRWFKDKIEKLNEVKRISKNLKLYNHEKLNELVSSYVEEIEKI